MGRHNGTWSPVYGQVWTHPKTARAGQHASAALRWIRPEVAAFLVVGWLNRICLWCLANGESGETGVLSDARIAAVAWPEALEADQKAARVGAVVRGALRAGGFLEGEGAAERVHDFLDHHARIVNERRRKRMEHDREDGINARRGAGASAEPSAEPGADARAEASAATDTDTDIHTDRSPPAPPAGGRARASSSPGPEEPLAAALGKRLGSSLSACRKQVNALLSAGWSPARIAAAIDTLATAGIAPWDWTKRALSAAPAPSHTTPCVRCASPATVGPGVAGSHRPLGLEEDLCAGHLTAWFQARQAEERAARAHPAPGSFQPPSGPRRAIFRPSEPVDSS